MPRDVRPSYSTNAGAAYCGDSLELIDGLADGSVNLCMTSPPFPLRRPKEYGNKAEMDYVDWLAAFAEKLLPKLAMDGSLVIDLGGTYLPGRPERSLYGFRVLLRLCDDLGYRFAQDFYWNNPARLPSPIEWVNKRKIRAKDSVDTVWWLSRTPWPKARIASVRVAYSDAMLKLLATGAKGRVANRPSGHEIGDAFVRDNGGALPSNLLNIPNTDSNGRYLGLCRDLGLKPHPARFPPQLPQFFVRMLTDPGDMVLDIFAGSNTVGSVAEAEGRRWAAFEIREDYVATSVLRFLPATVPVGRAAEIRENVFRACHACAGEDVQSGGSGSLASLAHVVAGGQGVGGVQVAGIDGGAPDCAFPA